MSEKKGFYERVYKPVSEGITWGALGVAILYPPASAALFEFAVGNKLFDGIIDGSKQSWDQRKK